MKISDQAFVRELNTSVVMDTIRLYAPMSRAEIAARSGLNRSTVTIIVNELIEQGFVHETIRQDAKIGRPGMLLQFNPEGGFAIGVEIGVDFLSILLTNFVADVLWQHRENFAPGTDRFIIMELSENLISQAVSYGIETGLRPLGIGVGLPGLVDERQGKLVFAPNLKWIDIPVRQLWMSRFNMPVFAENEAKCAAMGEYFYGVAHDVKDFIYLKTGVGLGAGIMSAGQLFKGTHGYAGEVGHVSLYGDGEVCGCGRQGCWETYVSQGAILRSARTKIENKVPSQIPNLLYDDLQQMTLDTLIRAARVGDEVACQTFEEIGMHLGVGLANLVNTFDPELVVLGGALSSCGEWLVPVIKRQLQENILPPLRSEIQVETSVLGEDASSLGAVAFVLDNLLREPVNTPGLSLKRLQQPESAING